jgi:DNA repair protein RadA/Sms
MEERRSGGAAPPSAEDAGAVSVAATSAEGVDRLTTGLPEFDRVLGGGLVPGALILLGGEPGIGKSTLLLQVARGISRAGGRVLYVSGEESAQQVRLRADRLGAVEESLLLLAETELGRIMAETERLSPTVLIIDSIQAIAAEDFASASGTIGQVRECAARLLRVAKSRALPTLLVGHVTKEGSLAGPKSLEHIVDAVVGIEGDRARGRRVLRAAKNRFGAVDEIALYEMTSAGLEAVAHPSEALLAERRAGMPGSAVTAAIEGTRALLVEVQALVGPDAEGSPRRVAIGIDPQRLALLLAVAENEANVALSRREIFVSCAGGVEAREPGIDLAVVAAVLSSAFKQPLPPDSVLFGEVGLLGEVRRVTDAASRLREAVALGFRKAFLPAGDAGAAAPFLDLSPIPVDRVRDLARTLSRPETPPASPRGRGGKGPGRAS